MRLFFIITFIIGLFFTSVFAQPFRDNYAEFFDYDSVLKDLKQNGRKSIYFINLDYRSMLYLDKASLKTLITINQNFLYEFNIDTSKIFHEVPGKYFKEYSTSHSTIKDLFANRSSWTNMIKQFKGENLNREQEIQLDKKIYMKDGTKAVFTVWGDGWSDTYKVILSNKKLRLELLYQIQENSMT